MHTDIAALNGGLGSPESQSDILVVSSATFSHSLGLCGSALLVGEDVRLLLESALALDGQFGRHDCGRLSNQMVVGRLGGRECGRRCRESRRSESSQQILCGSVSRRRAETGKATMHTCIASVAFCLTVVNKSHHEYTTDETTAM